MPRDPGCDIRLQRLKIGPITACNRVHPPPRGTGTGWARPRTVAKMGSVTGRGGREIAGTDAERFAADEAIGADGDPLDGDRVKWRAVAE